MQTCAQYLNSLYSEPSIKCLPPISTTSYSSKISSVNHLLCSSWPPVFFRPSLISFCCFLPIGTMSFRLKCRFSYQPPSLKPSWLASFQRDLIPDFCPVPWVANQYVTLLHFYLTFFRGRPRIERNSYIKERMGGEEPQSLTQCCVHLQIHFIHLPV